MHVGMSVCVFSFIGTSIGMYLFLKLIKWSGFPGILFSWPSLMNTIQVMYMPAGGMGRGVVEKKCR